MKMSLPKAIALAASLGAAASAHAVNHNPEGLGQVLLYPIYSVENGNSTAVHVTNTTNQFKAVKVRFLEGMNSQEVLDFNLYLSPFDVWTGVITRTDAGAKLTTNDNSCTAGAIGNGLNFRNTLFANSVPAEKVKGEDRTRVGHVEVIEMGVIDLNDASVTSLRNAIVHTNGVPGDCNAVRAAWQAGGIWRTNPGQGMLAPAGGLYGSATLINVEAGSEIAADAVALDNWSTTQVHALPGDEAPTLNAGDPVATFKDGSDAAFTTGWDAVSAVLMKQNLQNDFVNGAGLNGTTDLVITFPTKRHYVNQGFTGTNPAVPNPALPPFTAPWVPADSSACEAVGISFYDREERVNLVEDDQISPAPAVPGLALCHETNILGVGSSSLLGGSYVRNNVTIANGFETGWVSVNFANPAQILTPTAGTPATPLQGLPAIGFAAINIVNGDVGGLLSNYSASYLHKATTSRDRP